MLVPFSLHWPNHSSSLATAKHLKIGIILICTSKHHHEEGNTRQGHVLSLFQFPVVCSHQIRIDLNFGRRQSRTCNKFQRLITSQLSSQPQEGLLKVVVTFCGNIKILKILFTVECDRFGFNFTVFDIDFIAAEDDGDAFANTYEVALWLEEVMQKRTRTVPVGDVLISNTWGDVKHDNTTLPWDVRDTCLWTLPWI